MHAANLNKIDIISLEICMLCFRGSFFMLGLEAAALN
jgi:hypothetical protein